MPLLDFLATSNTFRQWLATTNNLISTISNTSVFVLVSQNATPNTTTGNVSINGTMTIATVTANGTVTANVFSGNGVSLTTLNASALATGTVPLGRLSSANSSANGVVDTTTQSFAGNKTFDNNVAITGYLTVGNNTITLNSTTLIVGNSAANLVFTASGITKDGVTIINESGSANNATYAFGKTEGALNVNSASQATNATNLNSQPGSYYTNASNLATGTVPVARLSLSASDLTNGVTGSGAVALATSPTLVTPNLGTPSAVTLTNATGLPESAITDGSILARLAANETVTGSWTFSSDEVVGSIGFKSQRAYSDTAGSGPYFNLFNADASRRWNIQPGASNDLRFNYYNGSSYSNLASLSSAGLLTVRGPIYAADGSSNQIAFMQMYNGVALFGGSYLSNTYPPVGIWSGGAERIRITTDGFVGIGTTSPQAVLNTSVTAGSANTESTLLRLTKADGYTADGQGGGSIVWSNASNNAEFAKIRLTGTGTTKNSFDFILANGSTNPTTVAMRITHDGNVGIGTTSPTHKLDVIGALNALRLGDSLTNSTTKQAKVTIPHYSTAEEDVMVFYPFSTSTTNELYIGGGSSSQNALTKIAFATAANNTTVSGTERMVIDSNGFVGIGTTSPTSPIHVSASRSGDWLGKFINTSATNPYGIYVDTSGGNGATFTFAAYTYAGTGFFVTNNGLVGIGTATPAYTLDAKGTGIAIRHASSLNVMGYLGQRGSGVDGGYFSLNSAGTTTVVFDSNGPSIINGGNLVVGGTTTYDGTDVTSIKIQATTYPSLAFYTGGTQIGMLWGVSTVDLRLEAAGARDLKFFTNNAERLRLYAGGSAHFYGSVTTSGALVTGAWLAVPSGQGIYFDSGSNTYMVEAAADQIYTYTGGSLAQIINTGYIYDYYRHHILYPGYVLYLDGGGDTYIYEYSANYMDFYAGGNHKLRLTTGYTQSFGSHYLSSGHLYMYSGYGFYLDSGSDTYFYEAAANQIDVICGGGLAGRFTSGAFYAPSISKGSGSFHIRHPLPEKTETHDLVHSFIEGPFADLIYRGTVTLVNGTAAVNIDTAAGMTEGTFVALCRNVQCFTSNETDWTAVRGRVAGNILTIDAQDATSTATVSWMVIGERQDPHMMESSLTDENGRVIVEPVRIV